MRYIGNKNKLLQNINKLIDNKIPIKEGVFCDLFSGTSGVSEIFKDKFKIIANDNLYFCFVLANAKLNNIDSQSYQKLGFNPFNYLNENKEIIKGFIYNNYSPGGSERKYFSKENAGRIDFMRWKIEDWKQEQRITDKEYFFLIGSLLESISRVANVAGVYGSYLNKWDPRSKKELFLQPIELNKEPLTLNEIYNENAENLIEKISGDILYIDPPYTKNQYSIQYHILETIAKFDNPKIKGKTGARNTTKQLSNFSKKYLVNIEFEKIIAKSKFKYIIFSYSSAGLMSKSFIESVLKRYGKEETYYFEEVNYRQYKNYKSATKKEHKEFLFFIEKKSDDEINFASPLNYIGGKFKLINFIKLNAPKKIDTFLDLFGGGFNVGINFNSKIIYNDHNVKVKQLMEMFYKENVENIYSFIEKTIKKYNLEKNKKDTFVKLRNIYNSKEPPLRDPYLLYVLILYGYQQQIRFNSKLQYNNTVGQAGFNDKILEKLISFSRALKEKNISFLSENYLNLEKIITKETFVYCDPPYLITTGSYNDGKRGFEGWSEKQEMELLGFLERINKKGVKFMLSNIINHKEKRNYLLEKWVNKHKFYVHRYNGPNKRKREELLITNYKK